MGQAARVVLTLVTLFVGDLRADLGLAEVIPDLVPIVNEAIGEGLVPLLEANATIEVDVGLDRSRALATVVSVTNIVNQTVSGVFLAAQEAVVDNTSTLNVVFGRLYKADVSAEIGLQDAIEVAEDLKSVTLTAMYIEVGVAINTFQFTPNSTRNLRATVTPELVDKVADVLWNISASVSNLGSLFTEIVQDKNNATVYIVNINTTIDTSITTITSVVEDFTKSAKDASNQLVQPIQSVTSNIAESYADITANPQDFNGGNITDLVLFLGVVGNANLVFGLNTTMNLNILQANVNRTMAFATATAANALTSSIRYITNTTSTNEFTTFGPICSERYFHQLHQLAPKSSLLSNCLKAAQPALAIRYKLILSPLLAQLESKASSFGSSQIKTCLTAACSSAYFRAFLILAEEVVQELQAIDRMLAAETQSFSTRIAVCANATAADVVELAQQAVAGYNACLVEG
ncbi:hypothetical protein quinque_011111 [Culex quinquefasciatus]